MRSKRMPVTLALLTFLLPTVASAATRVVDVDGTYDAGTDTCAGTDPAFTTIQSAVTAAVDGDTVLVCPGTYNEIQITINKALSVQSVAGAATTIIDGGGGTGLAFSGTVVINATTGNVLFDGFTVRNAKAGPSSVRFNVRVGSPALVTYTVTHNVLLGSNNPLDGSDYGLYAAGPVANDTLIFQFNELYNHGSNTILIERHKGPTDVSFNTFTRGVRSGTISAYVNMSHTNDAITTLQKVSNNTIDMANDPGPYTALNASSGIVFIGALTGTTIGSFSNVEISNNTIFNLRSFRRGIVLSNSANTLANQARGEIANALISCNVLTWTGATEPGSVGVQLRGFVSTPTITGNAIDGVNGGFQAVAQNGHIANTATFGTNSVTDTGTFAVDWQPTGALSAENNWWGSATGPTHATNPGGTGGTILNVGPVDFTPWLVSGGDADPGTCFVPGCGNGTTDPGEDCDQGGLNGDPTVCCTVECVFVTAGTDCRAAAGVCDVAETCTGGSGACPADAVAGPSVECRPSAGACDPAETCDSVGVGCPADAKSNAECRPSAGSCDIAESCDGAVDDCPADGFAPPTQECRASGGICDVAEQCTGGGASCPADGFASAATVCRTAVDVCDAAENCTGGGADCPADGVQPPTTVCRPAAGDCDVAETCNGGGTACPSDGFAGSGTTCSDGDVCTQPDACDANGACGGPPIDCDDDNPCTDDTCTEDAGDFLCVNTNNQTCVGPNCGNGLVDAGETCDPPNPAIDPNTNQPECRNDCTSCGDGVVQANNAETCDDGNIVSGCRPDQPQRPLDDCLNSCRLPICDDPSRIKLTSGFDALAFHGRLVAPSAIDFSSEHFVIQLATTDGTVIYRDSLLAGSVPKTTATAWKYRNKAAKETGGISAMKIRGKDGYYVFTLQAYGDGSAAVADMRTQVFVGATQWALRGVWTQLPGGKGWRLNKKSVFLEP